MKISARNVLPGKVKRLAHGAVNSEVIIELPGGNRDRRDHHQKLGQESGFEERKVGLCRRQNFKCHDGRGLRIGFIHE